MEEIMKELLPVMKEAISTGRLVGVWWIFGLYGLGFVKSLIKYLVVYKILEMVINLFKYGFDKVGKDD